MYFIAIFVVSHISIAPLSCFPHVAHLKPLSFMLNLFIFSFCLQILHSSISGLYPIIYNNRKRNIEVTNSKFLFVFDITYSVFKYNCSIL